MSEISESPMHGSEPGGGSVSERQSRIHEVLARKHALEIESIMTLVRQKFDGQPDSRDTHSGKFQNFGIVGIDTGPLKNLRVDRNISNRLYELHVYEDGSGQGKRMISISPNTYVALPQFLYELKVGLYMENDTLKQESQDAINEYQAAIPGNNSPPENIEDFPTSYFLTEEGEYRKVSYVSAKSIVDHAVVDANVGRGLALVESPMTSNDFLLVASSIQRVRDQLKDTQPGVEE